MVHYCASIALVVSDSWAFWLYCDQCLKVFYPHFCVCLDLYNVMLYCYVMLLKYHLHYPLTYQMRPSDANWFGLLSHIRLWVWNEQSWYVKCRSKKRSKKFNEVYTLFVLFQLFPKILSLKYIPLGHRFSTCALPITDYTESSQHVARGCELSRAS